MSASVHHATPGRWDRRRIRGGGSSSVGADDLDMWLEKRGEPERIARAIARRFLRQGLRGHIRRRERFYVVFHALFLQE